MKLDKTELKMLHNLHKNNKSWKKHGRWIFLFAGSLVLVFSFVQLEDIFCVENELLGSFLSVMIVQIYLGIVGGSLMLSKSLFHWNGNPKDILLLKVIEDSLGKNNDEEKI